MAKAYLIYGSHFVIKTRGGWPVDGTLEVKVEAVAMSREVVAQKLWEMAKPYFQEDIEKEFLKISLDEARRITERDLDTRSSLHLRRFYARIGEIPLALTPSQG